MDKNSYFKRMAYFIMGIFFYLNYLFPINKKKILLIMTHDDSDDGNVGSTYKYFQQQDPDLIFRKVNRENYTFKLNKNLLKNIFYMFIVVPYHISTSRTIFMDNVFLPFSKIQVKDKTRLVQLWHGTGAIKKFGLECEEGWIKKLGIDTNRKTTHFIVGSSWMKEVYKKAFGTEDQKIFNIGCPRTDLFFNKHILQERKDEFFHDYPELKDKKIILYAPTFRDSEKKLDEIKIHLDIDKLMSKLDENYVLGLRLHPHVANNIDLDKYILETYHSRVYDFSHYNKLNTLLICCYILITDYSSIIYEYALTKKHMIFFCYDLSKFESSGRGFYGDYKSIIPGPIAFKTDEIVNIINRGIRDGYNLNEFLITYLENCDGNARLRLYQLLMDNQNKN
jgi:CDP-glycerol glycerophosphotransferase (TagB/SpsB family)